MWINDRNNVREFYVKHKDDLFGLSEKEVRDIINSTCEGVALTIDGMHLNSVRLKGFGTIEANTFAIPGMLKSLKIAYNKGKLSKEVYERKLETFLNYAKREGEHLEIVNKHIKEHYDQKE